MKTTTTTSINSPGLFDALDAMQQTAHAAYPSLILPGNAEPPVTPEPSPEERRDQGIKTAVEHADAERSNPKWSVQAEAYAEMMIQRRGYKPFLMEEIVKAAIRDGVPEPPDRRSWGHIIRSLAKRGIVRKMGYAEAATSNCSPKVLWGKAVPERGEVHGRD